jgi:peptidoglycan/LPS O-acetylase OafA/YrhL
VRTVTSPSSRRLDFLDCIRGLAASGVVLEHTGDKSLAAFKNFAVNTFSFGHFGVAIFFLTSGFVIPLSLERGGSLKKFWVSRFFRLYPAYWLSVIATTILFLLGLRSAEYSAYGDHIVRNFLVNLTMLQEFVRVPDAEGLYYTLAMELAFYLFFSLLFRFRLNRKTLFLGWFGTLGLALAGIGIPLLFHHRLPLAGLFYFLSLFIGTVFYRVMTKEINASGLIKLAVAFVVFTGLEIYCNYTLIVKTDASSRLAGKSVAGAWSAAFLVFCLFFAFRERRFPKALRLLGVISYSLYLFHPIVNDIVDLSAHGPLINISVRIATTILCSTAIYWLIERRFISIGRRVNQHSTSMEGTESASASRLVAAAGQ